MKRLIRLFIFVLCASFFGAKINAQSMPPPPPPAKSKGDARVEKALKQTKTDYQMMTNNTYRITLGTTGKRSQAAFVDSETDTTYGLEVRGVYSYAMVGDNPPTQEVANLLLAQNMQNVSFWAIQKQTDGKFAVINIIYIPASADGKTLDAALNSVVLAADEMEERLTKKDEY